MNDSIAAIEARHSERGFVCRIGNVLVWDYACEEREIDCS